MNHGFGLPEFLFTVVPLLTLLQMVVLVSALWIFLSAFVRMSRSVERASKAMEEIALAARSKNEG